MNVLYCAYIVEIHRRSTAKGVEKAILHVNSRGSVTELFVCTRIVLAIHPLPRLIYKLCRIATCVKSLTQINSEI